jgi:hypothetical protein
MQTFTVSAARMAKPNMFNDQRKWVNHHHQTHTRIKSNNLD